MRSLIAILLLLAHCSLHAQVKTSLKNFSNKNGTAAKVNGNILLVSWPAGNNRTGKLVLDLSSQQPLFKSLELKEGARNYIIASGLDPVFLLTVGKRDLVSQNGWNIFFDKVPNKPFTSNAIEFNKHAAAVTSTGTRTVISIDWRALATNFP